MESVSMLLQYFLEIKYKLVRTENQVVLRVVKTADLQVLGKFKKFVLFIPADI